LVLKIKPIIRIHAVLQALQHIEARIFPQILCRLTKLSEAVGYLEHEDFLNVCSKVKSIHHKLRSTDAVIYF